MRGQVPSSAAEISGDFCIFHNKISNFIHIWIKDLGGP